VEGVLNEVDDVVEVGDELVDVLPVEGRDETLVEEVDDAVGDGVGPVFDVLGLMPVVLEIFKN
jgi:hypothetical protein